jgi:hypothetical protein
MDIASFLRLLSDKLRRSRMAARELETLDFEASGRDISVHIRKTPFGSRYPELGDILGSIGDDCLRRGFELGELRRICFFEREVTVELQGAPGAARGEALSTLRYSIEGRLAPQPDQPHFSAAAGS